MTATDHAAEGIRARFRREAEALHSEGFLTIDAVAALLGVHRNTVSQMIHDGRLHAARVEDRVVTRREWIAEMPPIRKDTAAWRRENGYLSVAEAAELAGITRQAMQVRITRGTQTATRAGADAPVPGAWLIRVGDVRGRAA